jgi:hypothetical protein
MHERFDYFHLDGVRLLYDRLCQRAKSAANIRDTPAWSTGNPGGYRLAMAARNCIDCGENAIDQPNRMTVKRADRRCVVNRASPSVVHALPDIFDRRR